METADARTHHSKLPSHHRVLPAGTVHRRQLPRNRHHDGQDDPVRKSRNVKRVLVTGMAGTGKSSLLHELAARGYRTADTDYGGYFQTIDGEILWREDRVSMLLSSAPDELPGVLFVQGTTRNQVLFYPRFHHIVLLSAPPEILAERLTTRTTNPYGKDPAELAEVLGYQRTVEPLLRAAASLEVVTTIPITQVADIVLGHVL